MGRREDLHNKLVDVMAPFVEDAKAHVYFQPPATVRMLYPAIVYSLSNKNVRYADNRWYNHRNSYTVTVIDRNPDSKIPDEFADWELASFDRHYTADNLHHYTFRIYY